MTSCDKGCCAHGAPIRTVESIHVIERKPVIPERGVLQPLITEEYPITLILEDGQEIRVKELTYHMDLR